MKSLYLYENPEMAVKVIYFAYVIYKYKSYLQTCAYCKVYLELFFLLVNKVELMEDF